MPRLLTMTINHWKLKTDNSELMNMNSDAWMAQGKQVFLNTYTRQPMVLVRGQGARLWDLDGKEYLDFLAGIAVCNLGHAHPRIAAAVSAQMQELVHVSNLYYTIPQIKSGGAAGAAQFCRSGIFRQQRRRGQ